MMPATKIEKEINRSLCFISLFIVQILHSDSIVARPQATFFEGRTSCYLTIASRNNLSDFHVTTTIRKH